MAQEESQHKTSNNSKNKRDRITADVKNYHYINFIKKNVKKIHPELDLKKVCKIIDMYFLLMSRDISEGHDIDLKQMGFCYLSKKKLGITVNENDEIVNKMPIDWKATNELWKKDESLRRVKYVRFMNHHSDGYTFEIKYTRTRYKVKNKSIYTLKKSRTMSRNLAKNIKNKLFNLNKITKE
jgi:hypothetical protein